MELPEYYVALRVANKIISPQGAFIHKYKELWGEEKDVSTIIEKLKHTIELDIANNIKKYSPNFSSYQSMPQSTSIISKNSLLNGKVIQCKTLKEFKGSEASKRTSYVLKQDPDQELEKTTTSFIYLIELIPFLSCYELSDSFSSDVLYEDASSDEINTTKVDKSSLHSTSNSNPFPIFRYNRKPRNTLERSGEVDRMYHQQIEEDPENLLPYYLLVNSYKICEKVSHSLQILFMTNRYPRIYILDQIAFIIKEVKLENLDTPKRVVSLYNHLDMFLKFWKDLVKVNTDEREFLQNKNQYEGDKAFTRDFEIILRLIETLCT